jgi:ABC-type nickel/cobalt efflux system permease component RcnA
MKLSYTLFYIMIAITSALVVLSFIIQNQLQLLGINVASILSIGLLFGASLYAFDDYSKEKHNKLTNSGN